MLLDKGDDVVVPLFGRLEAAHAVPGDNEFVTTNTAAVAVQMIPGILQHLLDVDALFEIFIGQFRHNIKVCLCCVLFMGLHSVAHLVADMLIRRRLKVSCGHIHRRIHSRFEVGV